MNNPDLGEYQLIWRDGYSADHHSIGGAERKAFEMLDTFISFGR
jgi:hypothetical protein